MSDPLDELLVDLVCKQLDDLGAGRRDRSDLGEISAAAGVPEQRVSDVLAKVIADRQRAQIAERKRRAASPRGNGVQPRPIQRPRVPNPASDHATSRATTRGAQPMTTATPAREEWEAAADHPVPRIRQAHRDVVAAIAELNHAKAECARLLVADRAHSATRARIAQLQAELEKLTALLPEDERPGKTAAPGRHRVATCPDCGQEMGANNLARHRSKAHHGEAAAR